MRLRWLLWMIPLGLLATCLWALAEEVILTTYYPSPRGVYKDMKVVKELTVGSFRTPHDAPTGTPFSVAGAKDPEPQDLLACDAGYDWYDEDLDGEVDETDECRLTGLVVTPQGQVGIGTPAPAYKLEVRGPINATDYYKDGQPFAGGGYWTASGTDIVNTNTGKVIVAGAAKPTLQLQKSDGTVLSTFHSDDPSNVFIGTNAGLVNTPDPMVVTQCGGDGRWGKCNTFIGTEAGRANTTGYSNTAMGRSALYAQQTGANNTAVGMEALRHSTASGNNTAVGYFALGYNGTGIRNTAVGVGAGRGRTVNGAGSDNTAVGMGALSDNNGSNNTAVGFEAGRSSLSGNGNVFMGYQAGLSEMGSDKLYIANSGTNTLIYGDFAAKQVEITDVLRITPRATPPTCNQNGLIYVDSDGEGAVCYCNGSTWSRMVGTGICG